MNRRLAPFAVLLLAGCVSNPPHLPQGAPGSGTIEQAHPAIRYEELPGRDAQTVARMRATAPPETARIDAADADAETRLTSQGYVRIGRSHFPVDVIDRGQEADAHAAALRQARDIGADRVLLAPPGSAGMPPGSPTTTCASSCRSARPSGICVRRNLWRSAHRAAWRSAR
jgi:hypothetical protein